MFEADTAGGFHSGSNWLSFAVRRLTGHTTSAVTSSSPQKHFFPPLGVGMPMPFSQFLTSFAFQTRQKPAITLPASASQGTFWEFTGQFNATSGRSKSNILSSLYIQSGCGGFAETTRYHQPAPGASSLCIVQLERVSHSCLSTTTNESR